MDKLEKCLDHPKIKLKKSYFKDHTIFFFQIPPQQLFNKLRYINIDITM